MTNQFPNKFICDYFFQLMPTKHHAAQFTDLRVIVLLGNKFKIIISAYVP